MSPRPNRHDSIMRFRMQNELRKEWLKTIPPGQSSRLVRAFMNRLVEEVHPMEEEFKDTFLYNLEMGNFSLIRGIKRRPFTRPWTKVAKKEYDFGDTGDEKKPEEKGWDGHPSLYPKWW